MSFLIVDAGAVRMNMCGHVEKITVPNCSGDRASNLDRKEQWIIFGLGSILDFFVATNECLVVFSQSPIIF